MSVLLNPYAHSASFVPTNISGSVLWLDGADDSSYTLVSGKVSQWNDKSTQGGNHAVQSTDANRPTRNTDTTSGTYRVTFSGASNTRLTVPDHSSLDLTSEISLFVALAPTAWDNFSAVIMKGDTFDDGYGIRVNGSSTLTYGVIGFGGGFPANCALGSTDTSGRHVYTLMHDSTTIRCRRNRTETGTLSHGSILANNDPLFIGARGTDGTADFTGDVFEIIIYNRLLTNTERDQVENYLTTKWSLS